MSLQPIGISGTKTIHDIHEITDDIGRDLVLIMQKKLHQMDKEYTGNAIQSISYDDIRRMVGSDLDYVYNIEFGRQKGNPPPFDKIKDWVEKKLGIHDPESREVAGRIVNSIASEGIPMTRFTKLSLIEITNGGTFIPTLKKKPSKIQKGIKKINKKIKKIRKPIRKIYKQKKFITKLGKKSKGYRAFK